VRDVCYFVEIGKIVVREGDFSALYRYGKDKVFDVVCGRAFEDSEY
jgi:hypothetical protein